MPSEMTPSSLRDRTPTDAHRREASLLPPTLSPGGAENDGDADEPADGAMKLAQLENSHLLNEHNLVIRDISHSAPQANAEPTPAANGGEAGTVVRVPSEADWFDPTKLHEKEKIALPDFFNGKYPSKNSHTYRQYR